MSSEDTVKAKTADRKPVNTTVTDTDEDTGANTTTSDAAVGDSTPKELKDRLFSLAVLVDEKRQQHRLASEFYNARYFWFLFLPSIALTLASGILSVFTGEQGKVVATISFISVFWQSLQRQLDYSGAASLHEAAACALDRIDDEITFFRKSFESHSLPQVDDFFWKCDEKFQQAVNAVPTPVPIQISGAYGLLQATIEGKAKQETSVESPTVHEDLQLNILFELLFSTFSNDRRFPYFLLNAANAVDKTMKLARESMGLPIKEEHNMPWEDAVENVTRSSSTKLILANAERGRVRLKRQQIHIESRVRSS